MCNTKYLCAILNHTETSSAQSHWPVLSWWFTNLYWFQSCPSDSKWPDAGRRLTASREFGTFSKNNVALLKRLSQLCVFSCSLWTIMPSSSSAAAKSDTLRIKQKQTLVVFLSTKHFGKDNTAPNRRDFREVTDSAAGSMCVQVPLAVWVQEVSWETWRWHLVFSGSFCSLSRLLLLPSVISLGKHR